MQLRRYPGTSISFGRRRHG